MFYLAILGFAIRWCRGGEVGTSVGVQLSGGNGMEDSQTVPPSGHFETLKNVLTLEQV